MEGKGKGKFDFTHVMTVQNGADVQLHLFLTFAIEPDEWLASPPPPPFYPLAKAPGKHLPGSLSGSHSKSVVCASACNRTPDFPGRNPVNILTMTSGLHLFISN
jgi:hypothetical protein